jgi:hypothetical protein
MMTGNGKYYPAPVNRNTQLHTDKSPGQGTPKHISPDVHTL